MIITKSNNAFGYTVPKNAPAVKPESVTPKDMTMKEYKQYINDKISGMTPSNGGITEVSISEDAFKEMKNNPEYENWVLNQVSCSTAAENGYTICYIGKDRNSFRTESWNPEDMKKIRKHEEKEKEELKRRRKKELEAKIEHYAQYKRMLQENSIRKAELEMNHIGGIYDDAEKSPQNLNAVSSYKAVMNGSNSDTSESQGGSVAVNVEKRSRQIASAKTPDQLKIVVQLLKKDLADCKNGVQKGWCDDSEVAKVEALIRRAEERKARIPSENSENSDSNANSDTSFLLNMIM